MYMQPITAATQARKPRAAALKLTAGVVSLPFVAVAMLAYWAVTAMWLIVAGAGQVARGSYDCLTFLGGELIGH